MATWRYHLTTSGAALREAIHDAEETVASCRYTLVKLQECLQDLHRRIRCVEYLDYFSDLEETVRDYVSEFDTVIQTPDDCPSEGFYRYALDCVNECLVDFYDACDTLRIWIGL